MDQTVIAEYFRWSPGEVRAMPVRIRKYWTRIAARRMGMDEIFRDSPDEAGEEEW